MGSIEFGSRAYRVWVGGLGFLEQGFGQNRVGAIGLGSILWGYEY